MTMYSLIEDACRAAIEWESSAKAVALLSELDAAEREADRYSGKGWSGVAEAFTEHARECEDELDSLRSESMKTAAKLQCQEPEHSDEWLDALDAADEQAVTVKQAIDRARRLHFGDALMDEAA